MSDERGDGRPEPARDPSHAPARRRTIVATVVAILVAFGAFNLWYSRRRGENTARAVSEIETLYQHIDYDALYLSWQRDQLAQATSTTTTTTSTTLPGGTRVPRKRIASFGPQIEVADAAYREFDMDEQRLEVTYAVNDLDMCIDVRVDRSPREVQTTTYQCTT